MSSPDIGLDIGSRMIKMVRAKAHKNRLQVLRFGCKDTPEQAVEAGNIYDPRILGEVIAELAGQLGLKGKAVVTAVSGPQVYTRILSMPKMKENELREAVRYEATTFLPIAADDAVMDIYPLSEYQDAEGGKVKLFFAAVRRTQVQNLKEVCKMGGINLKVIEIEPLALNRLFRNETGKCAIAFLNVGASRSYFSVFKEGVLLFNRYFSFGYTGFQQSMDFKHDELGDLLNSTVGDDYLLRDIVSELTRSVEYYDMKKKDELKKILVTGGGARIPGFTNAIAAGVNCEVDIADTLEHIILPGGVDAEAKETIRYNYAVALGLAARGGSCGTVQRYKD